MRRWWPALVPLLLGLCAAGGLLLQGALGRADPAGVWPDASTGRTWQDPPAAGAHRWPQARAYCESLQLAGHADWRLPTIDELRSLIRGCPATVAGGGCPARHDCKGADCFDDACLGCAMNQGPAQGCYWDEALGGSCDWYWSASSYPGRAGFAWFVDYPYGFVLMLSHDYEMSVRCVR